MAHYSQAARVLPASGNPYNQLAVMAYSARNDLLSVSVAEHACIAMRPPWCIFSLELDSYTR